MCSQNYRWGLGPIQTCKSGANHAVFHAQNDRLCLGLIVTCYARPKVAALYPKTTHEGWDPYFLVILMLITLFCIQKNWRWLVPIETSISDVKPAVVRVQNNRSCLGPIETCYSGPEVAVLHAKTTGEVFDLQRLVILSLKSLFCMHKTRGEGWNQYRLFILVLSTQLCALKTTDEVWDP